MAQTTFRTVIVRTLQVWGARFAPLTLITLALIYANALAGFGLDAFYFSLRIDPFAAWAVRYFGGWAINTLTGALVAVVLIRISLRAMGHEVVDERLGQAIRRHALAIAAIYAILAPGDMVADMLPPWPYLAVSMIWSLATALFICSDVTRVSEETGVRASLGRSFALLRPHLWLVLALTVLWEGLGWFGFLAQNPQFLAEGIQNSEPVSRWLIQPLTRTAAWLFGMLGSIVLYADLRLERQEDTGRIFD